MKINMPSATIHALALTAALTFGSSYASALTVSDRVGGLIGPDQMIDFGNGAYSDGTVITNQFSSSGVIFGDNFKYRTTSVNNPTVAAGYLQPINRAQRFGSIFFTQNVTDAVFSWLTPPASTQFKALLNGNVVDSFIPSSSYETSETSGRFYGFENLVFDEIQFNIFSGFSPGGFIVLDNLQFNLAAASAVPIPAALPLFGSGLALMGFVGWRRKRKAQAAA